MIASWKLPSTGLDFARNPIVGENREDMKTAKTHLAARVVADTYGGELMGQSLGVTASSGFQSRCVSS